MCIKNYKYIILKYLSALIKSSRTRTINFRNLKLLTTYKKVKAYKTVIIEIRTKLNVYFKLIQLQLVFSCDASSQS